MTCVFLSNYTYKLGRERLGAALELQPAGNGLTLSDALSLSSGVLKVADAGAVALKGVSSVSLDTLLRYEP